MKIMQDRQIMKVFLPCILLLINPLETRAGTIEGLDRNETSSSDQSKSSGLDRLARPPRILSFADRYTYQTLIEEVYWSHRIWPREQAEPKPSLEKMMSPDQIKRKVESYLRNSQAVEKYWPISVAQLQAEMERMAQHTTRPGMLRELFAVLGNDPFVIAECLARPVLVERLAADGFKNQELSDGATLSQTSSNEYVLPQIVETGTDFSSIIASTSIDNELPMATEGCGWTATSQTNAPISRSQATAVWTGSEMIVWGGLASGTLDTGGRYNPATDSWTATSQINAPSRRFSHTAIWTGTEMIIWGGLQGGNLNTGGRYNPGTDTWTTTSMTNAPEARAGHAAIWTGTEMIVWGGSGMGNYDTGGKYNPGTDSWVATSVNGAPTARYLPSAIWTGSEMIVWGGGPGGGINNFNTGGKYNPVTDSWTATSVADAPLGRYLHAAVWTGREMVVWGGYENGYVNTGGKYDPATDNWTATTLTNAPSARIATAIWTGAAMVIWGGSDRNAGVGDIFNDGRIYNPTTDSWTATEMTNAPTARAGNAAVWTGTEMIIWGGAEIGANLNTGGRLCLPSGPTPTPHPTTLGNISTRLKVETGNNALIGGFIVSGTQSKNVIVRAIGPSLGVAELLADPVLELRDSSGALLNSNDNWRDTQEAQIIATTIPPTNDLESAIVATLPANNSAYTAIVRGKDNGTGVGLVEVYDLDRTVDSRLANISTRGLVGTGNNVMIGGTIVLGTASTGVVLRGIGPSLTSLGIPDALVDPTMELRDGSGALVVANDNWQDDSTSAAQLTMLGLAPQNPLESGLFASLPPGSYTIILAGKNNGTGVGLVEAYHVQ